MITLVTLCTVPTTKSVNKNLSRVSVQLIERRIYLIRGDKVMIDADLAELYELPTKRFNQQVRRNLKRFPEDFMFRLTKEESESLRSQFATSKQVSESLRSQFATSKTGRGGRRYLPYALTEQGVAMLSSVLNSERAIEVNIAIMRAFVKLRRLLESNEDLNRKFAAVIRQLATHDKYFTIVFDELKKLSDPPTHARKQIGFKTAS
ncbi:MAG TPA: ORF6N domain-containing protein [Pyrinomonadaceae bacterium]|nr:ORF6N domain-containing protein [Pyrinomonadaceae bacterium]